MTETFRAHFDGTVLVPDEPVDLPLGEPLKIRLSRLSPTGGPAIIDPMAGLTIEEKLERLRAASGRIAGPEIPLEALRRENLYDERY